MGGTIKISASELEKLSRDTERQRQNVEEITKQINSAVSGTDWRSSAASSFKDVWTHDKGTLQRLQQDLESWSKQCRDRVPIANRVNEPFR